MNASERCGIDLRPPVAGDEAASTTSDRTLGTASDEAVSTAVVSAVADAKGVDPLDLDPLHDVVDLDALDTIFGRADGSSATELRFSMAGCEVVVRSADDVSVRSQRPQSDARAPPSRAD